MRTLCNKAKGFYLTVFSGTRQTRKEQGGPQWKLGVGCEVHAEQLVS